MNYVPEELMRSTPRQVELTGPGKFVAVLVVLLIVGAAVSHVFLYQLAERDAARAAVFEAQSVPTEGNIVRLTRTSGKHPKTVVVYAYTVADRTYEGRARVGDRDRRHFQPGNSVSVRYLPSDPSVSAVRGFESRGVPAWVSIAAPIGALFGAVAIGWVLKRQRRFLSQGRPAVARVLEVKRTGYGQHRTNRVRYEFTDMSGTARTGSFDKARKPPEPGTMLTILYDRESPKRSIPYPMSLVRVSGSNGARQV